MQAKTLLKDGEYRSIRDMLQRINRIIPQKKILAGLDKDKQIYYYTASQLYEEVMCLGDGLIDLGLKGAHIAIFSENSCRYVLADITVSSGVGVVTPIDVNAPVNLVVTLLGKCDADAVLCGAGYIDRILEAQKECPRVKTLITLDRKVEGYPFYDELVEKGRQMKDQSVYRGLVSEPDAPAKILFTSGTTGANKPVLLSNANLAANMMNCIDVIRAKGDNTSMSVLPMHHATEINTHIMARIGCGRLTYINDNMRNMMVNIKIFKPDVITIVPMIATAFYKTIWAQAKKAGKDEKLRKGIKLCNLLRKFGIDKTHDLFKDVYAPFGGNLNLIVCGGSMLNPVVIKGMNDLGIQIHNGYGITECGPLISMNADTLDEHLSVGPACPGLEVKIENPDEDGVGELCVRGKSVSHGYYKDPKNTIVLQSGKNISPEEVENVIETHLDYADDIAVYLAALPLAGGTSRDILCAGLYIKDQEIRRDTARIRADIEAVNALLPEYKNIEYIELVDEEYEKTSTRKIRRTQLPTVCSGKGIHLI